MVSKRQAEKRHPRAAGRHPGLQSARKGRRMSPLWRLPAGEGLCLLVGLFACLLVCLFACLLVCLVAWLVGYLFASLFLCLFVGALSSVLRVLSRVCVL